MRKELKGSGASEGIAFGAVWFPAKGISKIAEGYKKEDAQREREKLDSAVKRTAERMNSLADNARKRGETAQADVLEAHAMIVEDPLILEEAYKLIEEGSGAQEAIMQAAEEQAKCLAALEDEYLKERARDVRQAAHEVATELCGGNREAIPEGKVIIAGVDVEPAQIAAVPKEQLSGIILCGGTSLGHACILARERGIPAVSLREDAFSSLSPEMGVLVDGSCGVVIVEPSAEEIKKAEKTAVSEEALHGPAVMRDGAEVTLRANVGNAEEAVESQKKGASGIGLFRSEFLFIGRDSLPDEEEQYEAYKKAVEACGKAPCIIRTLDVGGDKKLPAFPIPKEDNPFLGVRGIRAELRNETVLRTQLRALLRAAACGHCAVMLPMVTNPSEIDRVKVIAGEELMALKEEGKEAVLPNFGAMIETPATAVCAENIAKHAGFFSIGTNDLAQYTLAADRTNEAVADIGDALHPAVLRLIKHTIEAANAAGIPVTICGEIASDTLAAPILAAMGRVALSMGAGSLSRVRSALKAVSMEEAGEKLEKALSLEDAKAVREFLK